MVYDGQRMPFYTPFLSPSDTSGASHYHSKPLDRFYISKMLRDLYHKRRRNPESGTPNYRGAYRKTPKIHSN